MLTPALRKRACQVAGPLVLLLACTDSDAPPHPHDAAMAFDGGGDTGRDSGHDGGRDGAATPPPPDAGRDGAPEAGEASCEQKLDAFHDFLSEHSACSEDDDCEVIGDCGPHADFRAVRADAAEQAYALMRARCTGAYDGPMFLARCASGTCATQERTDTCCGCPWDEDAGNADRGR